MRKLTILLIWMVLVFLLPLGAKPHILGPQEVFPGSVVSILIWDDRPLDQVEAELQMGDKTVAFAEGFSLEDPSGKNRSILGILLPLSSTAKSGKGLILIRHGRSRDRKEEELPLVIRSRKFISEEIPLNTAMSNLRGKPNPEKARQAKELYALLTTVNPEAVYLDTPFAIPLKSLRTSSFYGDRRVYLYSSGATAHSIHTGVDFSAEPGTAINAAGRGRVVLSENRIITGETVVIEHLPGVYTLYYHLQSRFAQVGIMVEQGELIGTVGATGLAVGAHLHWEVRVNGVPVEPNPLIEAPLIDIKRLIRTMEDETK